MSLSPACQIKLKLKINHNNLDRLVYCKTAAFILKSLSLSITCSKVTSNRDRTMINLLGYNQTMKCLVFKLNSNISKCLFRYFYRQSISWMQTMFPYYFSNLEKLCLTVMALVLALCLAACLWHVPEGFLWTLLPKE